MNAELNTAIKSFASELKSAEALWKRAFALCLVYTKLETETEDFTASMKAINSTLAAVKGFDPNNAVWKVAKSQALKTLTGNATIPGTSIIALYRAFAGDDFATLYKQAMHLANQCKRGGNDVPKADAVTAANEPEGEDGGEVSAANPEPVTASDASLMIETSIMAAIASLVDLKAVASLDRLKAALAEIDTGAMQADIDDLSHNDDAKRMELPAAA